MNTRLAALLGGVLALAQSTLASPTPTVGNYATRAAVHERQASAEATYTVDPTLDNHTIFHPVDASAFATLPLIVWGNGACSADPSYHLPFLLELASWGHLVIASGTVGSTANTTSALLGAAIDWAFSSPTQYGTIDTANVATAGMSCGGIEAYEQGAADDRVTALGIFNSGELDPALTDSVVAHLTKPVFYFLGGEDDIAYENGMRDYAALPEGTPSWVGNYPVGHGGTYSEPGGGVFGTAGQHYFRWVLRGETEASEYFTGSGATDDGWTVQSKSLENI